jgi:hypothetical protein
MSKIENFKFFLRPNKTVSEIYFSFTTTGRTNTMQYSEPDPSLGPK